MVELIHHFATEHVLKLKNIVMRITVEYFINLLYTGTIHCTVILFLGGIFWELFFIFSFTHTKRMI